MCRSIQYSTHWPHHATSLHSTHLSFGCVQDGISNEIEETLPSILSLASFTYSYKYCMKCILPLTERSCFDESYRYHIALHRPLKLNQLQLHWTLSFILSFSHSHSPSASIRAEYIVQDVYSSGSTMTTIKMSACMSVSVSSPRYREKKIGHMYTMYFKFSIMHCMRYCIHWKWEWKCSLLLKCISLVVVLSKRWAHHELTLKWSPVLAVARRENDVYHFRTGVTFPEKGFGTHFSCWRNLLFLPPSGISYSSLQYLLG